MPDTEATAVFDAFVRACGLGAGRADLSAVDPRFKETLEIVRDGYAAALRNERADDPTRPADVQFHFDYIESDEVNAVAFCDQGISFVGVTTGLVDVAIRHAGSLSRSEAVPAALGVHEGQARGLGPVILHLVLSYVVSHEYGHHFWGHVSRPVQLNRLDEFGSHANTGLDSQIDELVADGYAIYLVAESLLKGGLRPAVIHALGAAALDVTEQDRSLLSALIISVGGFFAIHLTGEFIVEKIETATHPPPGMRMAFLMQHLHLWSRDLFPRALTIITGENYRRLMETASLWHGYRTVGR